MFIWYLRNLPRYRRRLMPVLRRRRFCCPSRPAARQRCASWLIATPTHCAPIAHPAWSTWPSRRAAGATILPIGLSSPRPTVRRRRTNWLPSPPVRTRPAYAHTTSNRWTRPRSLFSSPARVRSTQAWDAHCIRQSPSSAPCSTSARPFLPPTWSTHCWTCSLPSRAVTMRACSIRQPAPSPHSSRWKLRWRRSGARGELRRPSCWATAWASLPPRGWRACYRLRTRSRLWLRAAV